MADTVGVHPAVSSPRSHGARTALAAEGARGIALTRWALAGLLAYSASLAIAEWRGGAWLARDLCADIEGATRFHAINTTLSVFLLAAGAVLLLFAQATRPMDPGERRYFRVQAGLMGWLAVDDRFRLHESIGARLGCPDALVLLAVGLVQLAVLCGMARLGRRSARARGWLVGAAAAFALMCAIDASQEAFVWPGRLTVEDLLKTWGGACLFGFVWSICAEPLGATERSG